MNEIYKTEAVHRIRVHSHLRMIVRIWNIWSHGAIA